MNVSVMSGSYSHTAASAADCCGKGSAIFAVRDARQIGCLSSVRRRRLRGVSVLLTASVR